MKKFHYIANSMSHRGYRIRVKWLHPTKGWRSEGHSYFKGNFEDAEQHCKELDKQ